MKFYTAYECPVNKYFFFYRGRLRTCIACGGSASHCLPLFRVSSHNVFSTIYWIYSKSPDLRLYIPSSDLDFLLLPYDS